MLNRIAKHCKSVRQLTLLSLICFFIANTSLASSQSINVYLKLEQNNKIITLIQRFNQFLAQQGVFEKYQIKPYIDHHPLHITLYLADYNAKQIPAIIKQSEILAKQAKSIAVYSSEFIANSQGYVMLSVEHNRQLQKLSNNAVRLLADLRDKTAIIPSWAAQDKKRGVLFYQYGSPNVFNYFNPHFSIFSADHLNKNQSEQLYMKLQPLIQQFSSLQHVKVGATACAIGVGIADDQGQIVKELVVLQ